MEITGRPGAEQAEHSREIVRRSCGDRAEMARLRHERGAVLAKVCGRQGAQQRGHRLEEGLAVVKRGGRGGVVSSGSGRRGGRRVERVRF